MQDLIKEGAKLHCLLSSKTLPTDCCEKPINPWEVAIEGETEGLYHPECVVNQYTAKSHIFLLWPLYELTVCSVCGQRVERIEMFAVHDLYDMQMYHQTCVPSLEQLKKPSPPIASVVVPVEESKGVDFKKLREKNKGKKEKKVNSHADFNMDNLGDLDDSPYTEDEVKQIPDGKYIVNGWHIQIRTTIESDFCGEGKKLLSLAPRRGMPFTQIAFVNGSFLNVWKNQKEKNLDGQEAARILLNADSYIEYSKEYGKKTKKCGVCGLPLEEDELGSGIGANCTKTFG